MHLKTYPTALEHIMNCDRLVTHMRTIGKVLFDKEKSKIDKRDKVGKKVKNKIINK